MNDLNAWPAGVSARIARASSLARSHRLAAARGVVSAALIAVLTGCTNLGPRVVAAGSAQYNQVLQRTDDQQLLLNIVRLRYRDRPYFLEVSGVATQFSFSGSLGADVAIGSPRLEQDALLSGGVAVEESPTVSYAPMQGEDFARRMLTPIPLNTLALLSTSGWSIDRILRLAVQRINGIPNAPSAAGPTPDKRPEYEQFLRLTRSLRALQRANQIFIGRRQADDDDALVLGLGPNAAETTEFLDVARMLRLDPTRARDGYLINADARPGAIAVQTRSFLAMLYYVSQAVTTADRDRAAGRVTATTNEDGSRFEWSRLTDGLMSIHTSDKRPSNAAVSVAYRGQWFYIDDADLDAKSTFSLLGQLFALTAGTSDATPPVLTLPIGN